MSRSSRWLKVSCGVQNHQTEKCEKSLINRNYGKVQSQLLRGNYTWYTHARAYTHTHKKTHTHTHAHTQVSIPADFFKDFDQYRVEHISRKAQIIQSLATTGIFYEAKYWVLWLKTALRHYLLFGDSLTNKTTSQHPLCVLIPSFFISYTRINKK